MTARRSRRNGETHQLVNGQHKQSEHQVAEHLRVPTDTQMAGTKLVLETGTGSLSPGSDTVPDALRSDEAARAPRPGLALRA